MLDQISDLLPHFIGKRDAEILLQDIVNTSLAGLAVDPDYVRIIGSAHIYRIHRQIGNCPFVQFLFFTPCHTLCNRILMGTGESGKHQITGIGLALIHMHACKFFVIGTDFRHIGEIQLWIHTV